MEELPFDGVGLVAFSIDSIHFELPAEFKPGYRFAMTLKIGGSNTYFGNPVENSYPLSIGVAGVDSLYLVSQDVLILLIKQGKLSADLSSGVRGQTRKTRTVLNLS